MMKRGLRAAVSLLLMGLIFAGLHMESKAADGQYIITFKAGAKGSFSGGASSIDVSRQYGESLSQAEAVNSLMVKEGYYFTGWSPQIETTVTKRASYVAQYARIIDEAVYKVNYIDSAGSPILTPKIVSTDLGEEVSEWAPLIPGYQPDQEQLKKTISKKNGFEMTFTYRETGGLAQITPESGATTAQTPGGAGISANQEENAAGIPESTGGQDIESADGEVPLDNADLNEGDIQDEDSEVPLAGLKLKNWKKAVFYGVISAAFLLVAAAGVIIYKKRKKRS